MRPTAAGSRALAAVVVRLVVFSSCAGPEPEQSGGKETASATRCADGTRRTPDRSSAPGGPQAPLDHSCARFCTLSGPHALGRPCLQGAAS